MEVQSLTGTTLDGRYEIGRMIGGGGMGHVYEAQHTGTGRKVAIKVISTGEMAKDKHIVGRFQREAKAAGAVDTQHICQVLDTGTDPGSGSPFMVMELMTGEDVQQLLARTGPIAPELALKIVAQSCLGLGKAHEVDVVHRDIKPANLFLARRDGGEILVKLLDFGIAKVKMEQAQSAENAGLTRTGMMLGSPLYMSPEQARGAKTIDHRTDLWSMGVVLYQALCGRTPFQHIDALGELIMAICSEPARPLQELAPWVEADVARVVHKALALKVEDRFQSAQEMYEAIKALLPSGTAIDEGMLVGLTPEQKAHVARPMSIAPPPALTPSLLPPGGVAAGSMPSIPPPPSISVEAAAMSNAGTTGGLAGSRASQPGKGSSAAFVVAGGLVGMLVAGGVAWWALKDSISPPPPPAAAAMPPPAPVETAAAAPSEEPKVAPAPEERTVKLVVLAPEGAEVRVDGNPAKLKNDAVEITGPLGSKHVVTVMSGKDELEEDVFVTDVGAQPPKIELEKGKPARPAGPAGPAAPKTGGEPAPPKPPTGPKPGIETEFK